MPVLMNATVRRALAPPAERSAAPSTIGETNVFGRQYAIPLNSAILPTVNTHGDFDEMCLAANAGFVRKIELAAEIVPDIMDGAAAAISISEQHSRTIHILVVEDDPTMRNYGCELPRGPSTSRFRDCAARSRPIPALPVCLMGMTSTITTTAAAYKVPWTCSLSGDMAKLKSSWINRRSVLWPPCLQESKPNVFLEWSLIRRW